MATIIGSDATTMLAPPTDVAAPDGQRGYRRGAVAVVALLTALGIGVAIPKLVAERERGALLGIEARQTALARGRAEVIATWIEGVEAPATRLTESPSVKLFAQEMQLASRDGLLAAALRDQIPYMQLVVEEFSRQAGLSGAGLLGADGQWLVTDGQIRLTAGMRDAIARGQPGERLVRLLTDETLELLIALPITTLVEGTEAAKASGTRLVMVVPAKDRFAAVLGPRGLDAPGEQAAVLSQRRPGEPLLIDADGRVMPARPDWDRLRETGGHLQVRTAVDGRELLAVGISVPRLDWTVVQWVDREAGLAEVREFARRAWIMAGLAGSALVALLAAVGWLFEGRHQRAFAEQYRRLAERIEAQRRLLDDVTGAVPEMIGLKDEHGRYRYVNRAFCLALGRSPDQVLGLTDVELFGEAGAAVLAQGREGQDDGGTTRQSEERLPIGGRERIVHLSKVPFVRADDHERGSLTVVTDVTDVALERARHERLQRETVEAFARAVERADPWLIGHTARLRETAVAIGRRLALDGRTLQAIDFAATLSQLGKLFLPRELLVKPERLDANEIAILRTHVDHALAVLGDLEFDVPVTSALAQMHERLDGTGYPLGLAGDGIGMAARVLAVADVFCARTAPRSYRDAITVETALRILQSNGASYDLTVVRALRDHLTESGERLGEVV